MPQQIINIGTLPNDGTGDPLRTAYSKINDNFAELYEGISIGPGVGLILDFGTFTASSAGVDVDFGTIV